MTRLLVTRRTVPLDRADEYFRLWKELVAAVTERGGRAWIFGAAARDDHFLEFVESSGSAPLFEEEYVAERLVVLRERFAPMEEEEWLEATL